MRRLPPLLLFGLMVASGGCSLMVPVKPPDPEPLVKPKDLTPDVDCDPEGTYPGGFNDPCQGRFVRKS